MKPKLGFALLIAAVLHAALFSAVAFWPKGPAPVSDADFVARHPFFDEALSFPPEPEPTAVTRTTVVTRQVLDDSPARVGWSLCPVHQVEMAVLEAFLNTDRHGQVIDPPGIHLSNPHDPPGALRAARFPNARSWAWGDGADPRHNARIYICKECERAEQEWKLTQGR
jgi:hypothetical protein